MFTIVRPKVMLITQRKVFVKQTMLFDNCIHKRSQNINKKCNNYSEIENMRKVYFFSFARPSFRPKHKYSRHIFHRKY